MGVIERTSRAEQTETSFVILYLHRSVFFYVYSTRSCCTFRRHNKKYSLISRRHAAAALMSSSNPLAASPLTTLLVKLPTILPPSPRLKAGPPKPLFGGLLNCIGVFGNAIWSSCLNVGVPDLPSRLTPSCELSTVPADDGACPASP